MSLDKSIASGKEHRKPYHRSKRFDVTCRNHGSCSWCQENRFHSTKVREEEADAQVEEYEKESKEEDEKEE